LFSKTKPHKAQVQE